MNRALRIVVCIKQVPEVEDIKFNPETKTLIREGVLNVVNPFDRRAISEAVRLKQAYGAQITVLTMGPPQARDALAEALAMGCERAVHLCDRAFAGSDTLATSRALALAIRKLGCDIVLCGKYSIDAETGQVGPEVAELLDVPHVSGVRKLDLHEALDGATVERETDEGYDILECPLPALFTAAERLIRPIGVTKEQLEEAKQRPIEVWTAADLSSDQSIFGLPGSPTYVADITAVELPRRKEIFQDEDPALAVERLLQALRQGGLFGGEGQAAPQERRAVAARRRGDGRAVWVVGEVVLGKLRNVTLELLGKGSELAERLQGELAVVLLGDGVAQHVRTLAAYGADAVYLAEGELLAQYSAEAYAQVLIQAIRRYSPYVVLVPSTANGRDFAPRVAARLGLGLTGDCVGLELNEKEELVQLKPAFGGNIVAPILSKTVPAMATVRPGMLSKLDPDWSREAKVERLPLPDPAGIRTRLLDTRMEAGQAGVELDDAQIVVAIGAGVGGPENFPVVYELARLLGAAVGATRKVVDLGWLPRQLQIGLTGRAVAPKLYIAVGVSGAFNHLVGIQRAQTILAINSNPNAQIFKNADYGIVGDYAQVVPALTQALAQRARPRP